MTWHRDIVVIGASAGGVETISRILPELPPHLPASLFIVVHTSPHTPSVLPRIFGRRCRLPVRHPADGETFAKGTVYVAPPDHHLVVGRGHIRITRGPHENHTRPSIDPLFRSAALHYGPRVIGVVLTGFLDDGTAGLVAVKARGGYAIVQDPEDAREPSMPRNALEQVQADRVLPADEIGPALAELVGEAIATEEAGPAPSDVLQIETRIAETEPMDVTVQEIEKLGAPSQFACPECHGVLYEVKEAKPLRFRCRVGHAYTAQNLMAEQNSGLESALWTALRALEESASLADRMAERMKGKRSALHFQELAQERRRQADEVRNSLRLMRTAAE